MESRLCITVLILASPLAWTQAVPSAAGTTAEQLASPMRTPPSISPDDTFLSLTTSGARRNYLLGALTLTPAYSDNVSPYVGGAPVADQSYSVYSTFTLSRATPRLSHSFTYAPGATLYGRTSSLNDTDQGISAEFQYRPSKYSAVELRDRFVKSSSVFSTPSMSAAPSVGEAQMSAQGAIAPFADQLHNRFSGGASYQYARNGMIGAAGVLARDAYLDQTEASGLCDSDSRSGAAFYNLRLTETTYSGVTYRYADYKTCPGDHESDTQTHALHMFLSFYPAHGLSLSVSAGPQRYRWAEASLGEAEGWTGSWIGSAAWQGNRIVMSAIYSRSIAGGGAMAGAFRTHHAEGTARWQISPRWSAAGGAQYELQRNVVPAAYHSNPGGHAVSVTLSLGRTLGQHVRLDSQYQRLHQRYDYPSSVFPDANRASLAISYYFERPLGR